jgi:MFS family permease
VSDTEAGPRDRPDVQSGRDLRLLFGGQGLSALGNGFQTVALAVAVVQGGGGPGELGLIMASGILARLVFTLFGGVWADRLQPRRIMIGSDLVRVAAVSITAVLFAVGYPPVWLLCVLSAVTTGAGSVFSPAMMALKPMVTPPDRRAQANATFSLVQTGSSVIGPALGGLVVALLGAPVGFAVNAASFLASVVTVALVRARVKRGAPRPMWQELGEGWGEIRRRDWLLAGVSAATVYHVANGVVIVLVPVIAIRELGVAGAVGAVSAAEGLGGFIGAGLALRLMPQRGLRAGWMSLLLMSVWVLGFVWPGVLPAVILGAVVGYAGLFFFDVAWETAIQDHVPHRYLARVSSWDTLTSFLGMPLGNALAGPLSHALGIDRLMIGCAAVLFLAALGPLALSSTRSLTRPADGHVEVPDFADDAELL